MWSVISTSRPVCSTRRTSAVNSPSSPVSSTPSLRARATSSSAHARTPASSAATSETLRPAGLSLAGDTPVSVTEAVIGVILSGPRPSAADPQITPVTQTFGQSRCRMNLDYPARVFGCGRRWGMPVNVRDGDRDQLYLLPPSVKDWLPEGHLAFFVLDVVGELDLAAFYGSYRDDGRGGATYDPALMLGVLLYAYCTGERSSRRIERHLVQDVAYRVLAANQAPDHATLARFRRRHQDAIAALFVQVLGLCVDAGLVDSGVVAIDGTKLAADASFFANRTKEQLAAEILAEAERIDADEDERLGDRRGDELPETWARPDGRRARSLEALAQLERQGARDYENRMVERAAKEAVLGRKLTGPEPTASPARRTQPRRANTTDPDSRIISMGSRGVLQGYNAPGAATVGEIMG